MWRSVAEIVVLQAGLVVAGLCGSMATGAGLTLVPVLLALACLLGAWGWAHRVGRSRGHLARTHVRVIAARVGCAAAVVVALAYALVAWLPGQVDLPSALVPVVATTIGLGAGLAAAGLTLCGLDMGRPLNTDRGDAARP